MNEDQKYRVALLKAREAFKTTWIEYCKEFKIAHEEDYLERQIFMGCCGFLAKKCHIDIFGLVQTEIFRKGGTIKNRSETKAYLADLLMSCSQELDGEYLDLLAQMAKKV